MYIVLLEAYRKLEAGLTGQKRERFVDGDEQLALSLMAMLTQGTAAPTAESAPAPEPESVSPSSGRPGLR